MRTRTRFSSLLFLCLLPSLVWADQFDNARALVREHMQKNNLPAMSVAVWRDGRIVWEEGFGFADKENGVPATQDTMFSLASLSKSLTATGLMTLVQAGKVDLDKPANDYLGQDTMTSMVGDPRAVTVRRLANHTSGLTSADQWFYGEEVANALPVGEEIRRYGILVTPAGERFKYSNLGYGVLGHLMAQVSGRNYKDFMHEALFEPLGMTHSSVNLVQGPEKYQAVRYDYDRKPIPFYVSSEPASAAAYSSAHDLARFGMFMLKNGIPGQKKILSDESIDLMTSNPTARTGSPVEVSKDGLGYGLGWFIWEHSGYRHVGHTGSTSGVSTNFTIIPSENMGLVLLSNADKATPADLRAAILNTLLPDYQLDPVKPEEIAASEPFKPVPELVGTWKGALRLSESERQPMELKVSADGQVHVRIGEPRFPGRSTLAQEALVNRPAFKDGRLTGTSLAQILTADTKRYPHSVSLDLKPRNGKLDGTAAAVSVFDGFWIFGLPYWVELTKVADADR